MPFHVYILASRPRGAIYVGTTRDLPTRMEQHRLGTAGSHTRKYGITALVWFETHATAQDANDRERRLKRWRRAWKDALIGKSNPAWRDLTDNLGYL